MLGFLLRTVGALLLGAGIMALARQRAPSIGLSLAFLVAQLGLILTCGVAPSSALLLVVAVLAAFALCLLPAGAATGRGLGPLAGLLLAAFFLYWITGKYLLPLGADLWLASKTGGVIPEIPSPQVFAMVGISYISFKAIHFVLDWRAGLIKDAGVLEFLAWLFFFPSIVAGPIQRFQDWQTQRAMPCLSIEAVSEGLQRLVQGMFMKLVLADNLHESTLAAMSAGALSTAPPWRLALGAVGYSLYIYWDFAGYSSMAIGLGRFWGIRLPENFNWPFLARNLNEFWQRWHITLSEFLRDYIYYPLSLSTKRKLGRRYPNVSAAIPPLVTFLAIGVWHGATMGFLIFGLMHGAGVACLAVANRYRSKTSIQRWWEGTTTGHFLALVANFSFVTFSLVFFSLPNESLLILLQRLVN